MRKSFLACAIGLAMALWLVPPASADTVTIGAPAPSPTSSGSCNSCAVMQFASNADIALIRGSDRSGRKLLDDHLLDVAGRCGGRLCRDRGLAPDCQH